MKNKKTKFKKKNKNQMKK